MRRGAASDAAGQAAAHERGAAGDADEGVPLGELLRPNPVSTLEQFDPRSRCVVARHPQRVRPWQERSEAVQTMLEARDEATPPMFMVVIIKGKQYKLTLDDVVAAEKLEADINEYLPCAVNGTCRLRDIVLHGNELSGVKSCAAAHL